VVILNAKEQEYLLHALDTAHTMRELRQFYLWSQGALQALLPHRQLLCLRLDGEGRVARIDCLHSAMLEAGVLHTLCDPERGPAADLLRQWRQAGGQPLALDTAFGHALVHGSGPVPGGASCFMLLGLPFPAAARQGWLLQLLLPSLHLALQRVAASGAAPSVAAPPSVSPRQAQILAGVREGKSNEEIGEVLGISALTVKNHLQRLYRQLGVSNRAHAVALCAGRNFD